MSATVRAATPADGAAIRQVLEAAFPTPLEADLVDALAADSDLTISLVAEEEGRVVGYVGFSRMAVIADGEPLRALGLAPVAVLPSEQGRGLAQLLIEAGLARAEAEGEDMIFLVGEPELYGRFGFSADLAEPYRSPFAGRYFQAKALRARGLPKAGSADYAPAFARFE